MKRENHKICQRLKPDRQEVTELTENNEFSQYYRVLQEVHNYTAQFHATRLVTNRQLDEVNVAGGDVARRENFDIQEYTFEHFIEVEFTDCDGEQIASFATNWFADKNPTTSNRFIQKLKENSSIRQLATNPLLLTLLCLVFEESADFPPNRLELYKEGLNLLLRKWNAKCNIERQQIYKKLSVRHKEDLLSKIALLSFERGKYLFKQKEIEHHIISYICNLPGVTTEIETLQLDSKAVLKSIEAQHGLLVERARGTYSFIHPTFHEYFTAREIVVSSDPQTLETALKRLVSHITEKRWREVFLLTVGMLRKADYLLQLMKQKVDELLAQDEELQAFLTCVSRKFSAVVSASYKPVSVRAFYFDLAVVRVLALAGGTLNLAKTLDCNFSPDLEPTLALDLALDHALNLAQVVDRIFDPKRAFECVLERAIAYAHALEPTLGEALQQLKEQLPQLGGDRKRFKQWWKANGQTWTEQLRSVMIKHRHIGHNWQFSAQQTEALKQYYDANQLLADCLNSNFYVTRKVRSEIEESLLLPITEISQLDAQKYC